MKVFFKWLVISFFFLLVIGAVNALSAGLSHIHIVDGLLAIVAGAAILATLFYFVEVKLIPGRKVKVLNKVISLFGAYPVTDTITKVTIAKLDMYIELKFDLHMSEHGAYSELVSFHIPKQQIDAMKTKPDFTYKHAVCNGIPTYMIYQTNSMGLKRAKKKIDTKLLASALTDRDL